ncbi:MAG: 16S rRNA (guanine(527)-N(7))-methyltransferase RsmG [Candidatus Margulisiibacteriota bacterium]
MNKDKLYNSYLTELLSWNQKFNLTAITDPKDIEIKHFEDSRTVLQAIDLIDQKVIDIGTGAGFPGIPLKIERPETKLTLVEATRKKCEFLRHLVDKLSEIDPRLKDIEIIWGRAEKLNQDPKYSGKLDVAVTRAVAKLDKLIEYALPFLKPGGIFVAMKGPGVEEEIAAAKKSLVNFGGRIKKMQGLVLTNQAARNLIVVEKSVARHAVR